MGGSGSVAGGACGGPAGGACGGPAGISKEGVGVATGGSGSAAGGACGGPAGGACGGPVGISKEGAGVATGGSGGAVGADRGVRGSIGEIGSSGADRGGAGSSSKTLILVLPPSSCSASYSTNSICLESINSRSLVEPNVSMPKSKAPPNNPAPIDDVGVLVGSAFFRVNSE
jgi:hypothetical protein